MFRSIAVTTDFSEASKEAFGAATALARKFSSKLYLLHSTQSPQIFTPWQVPQTPAEVETRQADLQHRLEQLVRGEGILAGVRVEARALAGSSTEAIVDFQEKEKIDLLVMATHGHSGIKHFLLGSFTAKVLQLATCPVLVVRSTKESEGAPRQPFHPSRILIPYDFSRGSRVALDTAKFWARAFDASAKLLFVVQQRISPDIDPATPSTTVAEYYQTRRAEAAERLEALARKELDGIPHQVAVRVGHPAVEILKEAEELRAGLIVMGSRGLSVLDRLAMGSIAERTIQGAACPVLIVR
jgi:nucleotide-binding universal stress UspA family protein